MSCDSNRSRTPDVDLASRAYELVVAYDTLRVSTYQARPGNPDRVRWEEFGRAVAMRFPSVGYFNQAYGFRADEAGELFAMRNFFATERLSWKVHPAPDADSTGVNTMLRNAGGRERETLAFLAADLDGRPLAPPDADMEFQALEESDRELFFSIYLDCFGADPAMRAEALKNMTLLPDQPELHCYFARRRGRLVGICMLFTRGDSALLCAGATVPEARGTGVQESLIRYRLQLSRTLGCRYVASWTDAESASEKNLRECGMEVVLRQPVWCLPATMPVSKKWSRLNRRRVKGGVPC